LQVPDCRLHRLTPLEPASLPVGQRLELAPMDDLDTRVVGIDTPEAEIDHDLFGSTADVFEQDTGLLQLCRQDVSVVRVARERTCTHHQAVAMGDGNARLYP